ncbi:thyrostimulin alpha-2 subunit-like [Daphnia pulicaria]|uniref:thyrostimulin alpha-2 subunit-like n=1 Tax=Daphnia pulicaria TaxID=35523 RepID=UPI001EEC3AD2|nr:thyrostimulin alpha-2 subunit-like [Daphnia pulicaria]XP_046646323.1 thyrostimulin alpha-2 subunit-like [Daphnia pulicaria]
MVSTLYFWLVLAVLLTASNGEPRNQPKGSIRVSTRSLTSRGELSGCHQVGHTRRVTIPDCVSFMITTNACRGFCESWSVPSSWEALLKNPEKVITSVGQCCNIMASEDVTVRVMCLGGPRDFTFKSAKTCSCFTCKKD